MQFIWKSVKIPIHEIIIRTLPSYYKYPERKTAQDKCSIAHSEQEVKAYHDRLNC